MLVLGIDPGYATLGYGVVRYEQNRFTPVTYGVVTTPPGPSIEERLAQLYDGVSAVIERFKPQTMGIEELFFYSNKTTAINVAQARGVVLLCAVRHGLAIAEYTPMQVKQAVAGYGRADKKQVMEMTRTILNLKETPKPDDAADALAVAICHAHSAGLQPQQVALRERTGI